MENDRLLYFVDRLEKLASSPYNLHDPQSADAVLEKIKATVSVMKGEITQNKFLNTKPPSLNSSYADTGLTVQSVEANRSGLASTVDIDDSRPSANHDNHKTPNGTGFGFIEAVRMAALSVENKSSTENGYQHSRTTPSWFNTSSPEGTPVTEPSSSENLKSLNSPSSGGSMGPIDMKENHQFSVPSLSKSGSTLNSYRSDSHTSSASGIARQKSGGTATTSASAPASVSASASTTASAGSDNHSNGVSHQHANNHHQNSSESLKVSRRVKYFSKCFPAYRKLFRYETQSRSLLRTKSNKNYSPALSPDTKFMALVDSVKYQIFEIPDEFNDRPRPRFTGETGFNKAQCYVAMNNMWLVIASSDGIVLVISLVNGNLLFRKNLRLQVTALDVSADGSYIGIAVVKNSESESRLCEKQPLIFLICSSTIISPESAFEHPDIVSFSSPYKDNIRTLSFNDGETAMICSTEQDCRIFIVSLADYREPRILLRSRRNSTEYDNDVAVSECEKPPTGITGAKFLPNSRYVLLSSYAPNTPPVILDTKLMVSKGKSPTSKTVQYLHSSGLQQNVVIRFDKMGSAIQSCAVSSRGNGAAFADYSGTVYAVNLPSISTESRKIAVVFDLSAAESILCAPALKFSPDGTVLIAVDRKGDVHIADFGAGYPQQPGIMKTKVLS